VSPARRMIRGNVHVTWNPAGFPHGKPHHWRCRCALVDERAVHCGSRRSCHRLLRAAAGGRTFPAVEAEKTAVDDHVSHRPPEIIVSN